MTLWTEDRIAEAKRRYLNGESCSQIARVIGGVSRNAVIGILHRKGISRPAQRAARVRSGGIQKRLAVLVKTPSLLSTLPREPRDDAVLQLESRPFLVTATPVRLLNLTSCMCRWPVAGASDATLFCGLRKTPDSSYCADHARRAYAPREGKKRSASKLIHSLRRYA